MTKMIFYFILLINIISDYVFCEADPSKSKCKFPLHNDYHRAMGLLRDIEGETYNATDESGNYLYVLGFCTTPQIVVPGMAADNVAVWQQDLKSHKWVVTGRYNDTDIKIGNNWGFLQYGSGDKYNSHCGGGERASMVMLTCNSGATKPRLRIIEENNNKTGQCYYLFELEHPRACNVNATADSVVAAKSLGGGAIAAIVLIFIVALYLCGGMAFKKVFYNSEGVELVPNVDFWRRFGTVFANCVDYLCRPSTESRYQLYSAAPNNNNNNLTINDLDPDDDDEILVLP